MFYPEHPDELHNQVVDLLRRAEPDVVGGVVRGLVSPHAGYVYSGYTAAHGFSLLQGNTYEVVVVVSPSHHEYFDGISVYPGDAYRTPLGDVPVDVTTRELLLKESPVVSESHRGHGPEHAIEVQIPFLQLVVKNLTILPIVMGDQRREYCLELGRAIGNTVKGKDYLLVASSDLSHYYPSPVACSLDKVMVDDIERFDAEQLMSDLETKKTEACGGGPVVSVLEALHQLDIRKIKVLHQCNSGDVTGDRSSVVGYCSAVAYT